MDAHASDDGAGQVRSLGEERSHQQPAVAGALSRQFRRIGIAAFDEVLGCGDEIIEHMLLVRQVAGLVPLLAVFAATAQVRDRIHAARIEPDAARGIECGREADAVTAIAIQQRRIPAIALEPLLMQYVEGHLRPVLRGREFAHHLDVVEVHGRSHIQRGAVDGLGRRVIGEPGERFQVADVPKHQIVSAPGIQPRHRGHRQDGDFAGPGAAARVMDQHGRAAQNAAHIQAVIARRELLH